jgi:hypothetical protein
MSRRRKGWFNLDHSDYFDECYQSGATISCSEASQGGLCSGPRWSLRLSTSPLNIHDSCCRCFHSDPRHDSEGYKDNISIDSSFKCLNHMRDVSDREWDSSDYMMSLFAGCILWAFLSLHPLQFFPNIAQDELFISDWGQDNIAGPKIDHISVF